MPDYTPRENFKAATEQAAEPPKQKVSLELDADVMAFFQSDSEPGNWQQHMNDVLRYYMETNQAMTPGPEWEPVEDADSVPATKLPGIQP